MPENPKTPKLTPGIPRRPPAPALSYFNAHVARETARRERKLRLRRVVAVVGNALAIIFVIALCLFWRFGFSLFNLLYGHH